MSRTALTFAVYRHDLPSHQVTTRTDVVKVGRGPGAHLEVADGERMHAVIEVAGPEAITLVDLGHAAGTRVNGAAVSKCRLGVGDRIQSGDTTLVLEQAAPVTDTPTAPAPRADAAAASPAPFAVAAAPRGAAPNPFAADFPVGIHNPFAAALARDAAASVVAEDAAPGTYTYAMIQRGPAVSAAEVELPDQEATEVMILWGQDVLHVTHLRPGQPFCVGEEERAGLGVDYLLPAERIGTTRLPVVVPDPTGTRVVIPREATGSLQRGGVRRSLDELRAEGTASVAVAGATEVTVPQGATLRYSLGGFTIQVTATRAGKPLPRSLVRRLDTALATAFGLSFTAVASLIATMAATVPSLALTTEDGLDKSQLRLVQQLLAASAEREQEAREEAVRSDDEPGSDGGEGTRAKLEEGSMGKPASLKTGGRWGAAGDARPEDVKLAKAAALAEARSFGMIGMLNASLGGDPNAPTVPWGGDVTVGADPVSALGNMWGDDIGESIGSGGLGLTGIGEGGGGRGEGIGLGDVGTYGHGTGCRGGAGCGQGIGHGHGHGRIGGAHKTASPRLRSDGSTSVSGRLPPEVIQRIVRQNFGRFRLCYEKGLAQNPNLTGRVAVRFVINGDGAVAHVANGGSDLPDGSTVSCVVSSFYSLSFPAPENGVVTVVYPIFFEPG